MGLPVVLQTRFTETDSLAVYVVWAEFAVKFLTAAESRYKNIKIINNARERGERGVTRPGVTAFKSL